MKRPINERDEFLLSRMIDDDLPVGEAAALRARIEREPDLRKAYTAMTRIDSLLVARQADKPAIDWERFHRGVMEQVEAEALVAAARPKTFRLADYLRIALPLAAAAAILLVVWGWPRGGQIAKDPVGGNRPDTAIVQHDSPPRTPVQEQVLLVRYQRGNREADDSNTPRGVNGISVSYVHSEELQNEYRQRDEAARNGESSHWYMAGNTRAAKQVSQDLLLIEASSL